MSAAVASPPPADVPEHTEAAGAPEADDGGMVAVIYDEDAEVAGQQPVAVEPEPTREERLRMAAQMKITCDALSDLLKHYVQEEQDLKQMCAEFIVRDIEEENQRIALTRRCLEEQKTTMRSAAFVKWAHENNKGDLAHGAVIAQRLDDGQKQHDDGEAPTYEFHRESADEWWVGVTSGPSGAVTARVAAPRRVLSCPAALVQVMLAWRKAPSKEAASALNAIDAARGAVGGDTVLSVNGRVILPLSAPNDAVTVADFRRSATAFVKASFAMSAPTDPSAAMTQELSFAAWYDWCLGRAAATSTDALLSAVHESSETENLRDDGTDVIAVHRLEDVRGGLTLRVVTLGTDVVAAETPLPAVNHEATCGISAKAVLDSLAHDLKSSSAKNDATMRVLTVAATRSDGTVSLALLSCEKLTPATILDRWEWSDLCGVARIAKDLRAEGRSANIKVALRATDHQVVGVAPGGPLSEPWARLVTGAPEVSRLQDSNRTAKRMALAGVMAAAGLVTVGWIVGRARK